MFDNAFPETPLIQTPWIDTILPAIHKRPPLLVDKSQLTRVLKILGISRDDDSEAFPKPSTRSAPPPDTIPSTFDLSEYQRISILCHEALNRIGHSEPLREDIFSNDDQFIGIGLRLMLPLHRQQPHQVLRLVAEMSARYLPVPYHNSLHAAMVSHRCHLLAKASGCWDILSALEKKALIVSALGHDMGHPGRSAAFLQNVQHPLAQLYCNQHPLESYHCSSLLSLLKREDCNILSSANQSTLINLRRLIIQCILSTDMHDHFTILDTAKSHFKHALKNSKPGSHLLDSLELRRDVLSICLKAADLSYMTLTAHEALHWLVQFYQEVFIQRAMEEELGLKPTEAQSYSDMGSSRWYERNIVFGVRMVMPLGQFMSDVERKLKQAKYSNADKMLEAQPSELEERSTSEIKEVDSIPNEIRMMANVGARTLNDLAQAIAEKDAPTTPIQTVRKSVSTNRLPSWKGVMPTWNNKQTKTRKTEVYRIFTRPLEKTLEALKSAKYLTEYPRVEHVARYA